MRIADHQAGVQVVGEQGGTGVANEGSRNDPFLAFRFEVNLAGLPAGGFSDCSGLASETEITEYPEGGRNDTVHKLIGRSKQANLVLKRGIVDRLCGTGITTLPRA